MNRAALAPLCLALASAAVPAAAPALAPARPTAAPAERPRSIALEGGQNFRDLGGYASVDGRTVRWGLIFRSGSMHHLTGGDFRTLQALGLRTVVDFRSSEERAQEPVAWPAGFSPAVRAKPYASDAVMPMGPELTKLTATQAQALFAAAYTKIPYQFADQYRDLFAQLLQRQAPLAFNCSAGKDRTGVAAALLLTALGVPRETIIADYLLSNRTFDPSKTMAAGPRVDAMWRQLSPEVIKVFMGVDRQYIEAAFAAIERRPGGMDGYLRNQLKLDRRKIATLRRLYLL